MMTAQVRTLWIAQQKRKDREARARLEAIPDGDLAKLEAALTDFPYHPGATSGLRPLAGLLDEVREIRAARKKARQGRL